jgi:four helix bundle protein
MGRVRFETKRDFFEIARGSCREARAALKLAAIWGYVDETTVAALDSLGDRVCALLSKLISRAR